MDRFKIILKDKSNDLPKVAGVYSFYSYSKINPKPSTLNPIYIGKAINIQNRVKNHFSQPSYRDDLFIDKVDKIGYLETDSEIEALILEANLIKKYQPKFNVVWRDDKNYFYVVIAQNENKIPYIFITHQPSQPVIASEAKQSQLQGLLRRLRPPRNDDSEYIGPFVEGIALKKTLRFLRRPFPYYTTKKHPKNKCTWCHLGLCPGPELFENPPSPKASEGLREYRRNIKKLILILKGKRVAVLNSLKKEMGELSKDNKFEEAAKIRDRISNLQQVMSHTSIIGQQELQRLTLQDLETSDVARILKKIVGTKKDIHRIECYDISNIQGKSATGSMVVFINGKPDKSQYKKFRIKTGDKPNDIAMLKETLERRFAHPEWKYPEAMLIDGGIAQLNIAIRVKNKDLRFKNIRVISIAKRDKDLYIEGRKGFVPLKSLPQEIYNLILQLDDEAHRFAIAYHKKLRKESLLH